MNSIDPKIDKRLNFTSLIQLVLERIEKTRQGLSIIMLVIVAVCPPTVLAQQPADSSNTVFLPVIFRSDVVTGFGEWPQVQQNPQRTGYSAEVLGSNIQRVWAHPFQPEKIFPQVQAIVYAGNVFVGTEMGNMYAIDAKTGQKSWEVPIGAPILNSVAASKGLVFFGAMDGAVYALRASTGELVWRTQLDWRLGFSTAPVLADNKVLLGGRNGTFYALDPNTGDELWEYDVGAPILQTAAWDAGRVFLGAMDMHVYAIDTGDGSLAWESEKVSGMAFKDYWPVVYQGKIYIRPMGRGELGVDGTQVTNVAAQQALLADYAAHPENYSKSLFVFDEQTGQELPSIIHYSAQTMNGATSPPCVDRDGYLAMPAPEPSGGYGGGWGRVDPNSRIMVDVLNDGTGAGYGNTDENMNLTCAGNMILAIHTQEFNANYTGAFDLDNRRWIKIRAGGANGQMTTNTQGGGGNPASIADGMIYHISLHNLIARSTQ